MGSDSAAIVLYCGGDVDVARSGRGELARVDVGDFPQCCVDLLQIFTFYHQHRLRRVKVELTET